MGSRRHSIALCDVNGGGLHSLTELGRNWFFVKLFPSSAVYLCKCYYIYSCFASIAIENLLHVPIILLVGYLFGVRYVVGLVSPPVMYVYPFVFIKLHFHIRGCYATCMYCFCILAFMTLVIITSIPRVCTVGYFYVFPMDICGNFATCITCPSPEWCNASKFDSLGICAKNFFASPCLLA